MITSHGETPVVCSDHGVVCRYLGPDYGKFDKPEGEVTATDLPQLAHESFPLCMLVCCCAVEMSSCLISLFIDLRGCRSAVAPAM